MALIFKSTPQTTPMISSWDPISLSTTAVLKTFASCSKPFTLFGTNDKMTVDR